MRVREKYYRNCVAVQMVIILQTPVNVNSSYLIVNKTFFKDVQSDNVSLYILKMVFTLDEYISHKTKKLEQNW